METNLSLAIEDYLLRFGELMIPGLGVFSLNSKNERVYLGDSKIGPDSSSLNFSEEYLEKSGLSKYISQRLSISKNKANSILKKYAQKAINSLLNYERAELPGIGVLTKESDRIVFEGTAKNFDIESYYLPELNLAPIVKTVSENIVSRNEETLVKAIPVTVVKSDKVEYTYTKDLNSNYTKEEYHFEKEESSWLKPVMLSLLAVALICLMSLMFRNCNLGSVGPTLFGGDETEDTTMIKNELINNSEPVIIENINNHPNFDSYKEYLTPELLKNGCVIIVGSFKSVRNATKLRDKLIRKNLQPYTEIYGDYTRVGILFECQEEDLVNYLKKIRRTLEKHAWYLNPDMGVN